MWSFQTTELGVKGLCHYHLSISMVLVGPNEGLQ